MDSLRKNVGTRIRELRKSRRLTQEQLAESTGISTEFLSRVERGICVPSLERIVTIVRSLDLCLAEFFLPLDLPQDHPGVLLDRTRLRPAAVIECGKHKDARPRRATNLAHKEPT